MKSFTDVTPNLRRITFTAESLDTYPADCEGGHLKLFIAKDAPNPPALPVLSDKGPVWPEDKPRPTARTYTVRAIRPELKEIDIEFAMHDDAGPAVDFARNAKPVIISVLPIPADRIRCCRWRNTTIWQLI